MYTSHQPERLLLRISHLLLSLSLQFGFYVQS
jgi:hypothetical protein